MQSCTKINRPSGGGILFRERLFHRLDDPGTPAVTWISGPPGSGKTSLVSSYLEARCLPHLWYQVDAGDADLATFFYYLGLATHNAVSRQYSPMPLLTPEYLHGIPEFSRNFFTEMFRRLKRPTVLAFDNTHEVHDDSQLFEAMIEGFSRLPDDIRIIFMSRSVPPPQFARLRTNGIMNLLGWNDLRLTSEEFTEITRLWNVAEEHLESCSIIYEQIDGWAAGLKIVLEGADTLGDAVDLNRYSGWEEIFNYFVNEVFEGLAESVQDCLLKTAFFRRIKVPLAEELTGYHHAGHILEDLYRRNFFIVKTAGRKTIYEYHPLFREFLLTVAEVRFPSADLDQIKKKAAKLLEMEGQVEDAIVLLQQTGDLPNLTRLILEQTSALFSQGRHQTVEQWLKGIPEAVRADNPWLLFWHGTARMPFDPASAKPLFVQALKLFDKNGDAAGSFLAWSGAVDAIVYTFDSYDSLDEWNLLFNELVSRYQTFPSPDIEVRVITSLLHIFALRQPCHPDFHIWEKRGVEAVKTVSDIDLRINMFMPLVMAAIFEGDLVRTEKLLLDLREGISLSNHCSLAMISLKVMEVAYFWVAGRFGECERAFYDGLELAEQSGIKPKVFPIMCHGTAGLLSLGNLTEAKVYFDEMSAIKERAGRCEKGFYHIMKSWEGLLAQNHSTVLFHAEKSLKTLLEVGMPQAIAIAHLAMGYGYHKSGDYDLAADYLGKVCEYSEKTKSGQTEFACWLAKADFAYECGNFELGESSLATALSLGRKHGYFNCYFWHPETMAQLCCKALDAGIEKQYVLELIKRRKLLPESPPTEIEDWPWTIRIYTLGRFELVREDKPIRFSGKAKQKPFELLKALIALGGRKVSEFTLAETLWPESDGDMQHQALATTLHRLRRIVGIKEFIQYSNGHLSLDPRYCWVDAWAFERLLSHAEVEARSKNKESSLSAIRNAEKAILLYKGDFLPLVNREHWCINKKEHLKNRFLRGVIFLGRKLEKIGEQEKAVMHYQNAIDIEPLAEEFYQRLMIYYHGKGQFADAALLYQRCRKNLEMFLNVQPSKQTNSLYKSLLAGSENLFNDQN